MRDERGDHVSRVSRSRGCAPLCTFEYIVFAEARASHQMRPSRTVMTMCSFRCSQDLLRRPTTSASNTPPSTKRSSASNPTFEVRFCFLLCVLGHLAYAPSSCCPDSLGLYLIVYIQRERYWRNLNLRYSTIQIISRVVRGECVYTLRMLIAQSLILCMFAYTSTHYCCPHLRSR